MNLLGNTEAITTFKDPFKKDCIRQIKFTITNYQTIFYKPFEATVSFKNGNTDGDHKITAQSFPELVMLVEEFTKSLK
mgnify:CR=1 FL=1